jgi:hypothetical protein
MTLIGEDQVCARARVQEPGFFLATIPGVHTYSGVRSVKLEDCPEAEEKVFVFQRVFLNEPQNVAFLQKVLRQGYLIVHEFDDDPERWPEGQRNDWFTFHACHAVQTTTEPLAARLPRLLHTVRGALRAAHRRARLRRDQGGQLLDH